jgi:hypothetical protein
MCSGKCDLRSWPIQSIYCYLHLSIMRDWKSAMRKTITRVALAILLVTAQPANADPYMSMMDSANYSGVQFAGTLAINSAIDSSTGGSRVTQAQIDAQNRDIALSRECRNAVIKSTPVGAARTAGLQRCKDQYPNKMPADYPRDGGRAASTKAGVSKQSAATKTASVQSSAYRVSPAISAEVQNTFYNQVKAGSKETAEEIQAKLFDKDIEKLFGSTVRPFGLKANDVVDSTTAFWISMWVIANQAPNPTTQQVAAVRKQVQTSMAGSGKLGSSDADKQRFSQMMMYETILGLVAFNTDTIDKQQLAAVTHKSIKRRGMDLRRMRLTDKGFVSG